MKDFVEKVTNIFLKRIIEVGDHAVDSAAEKDPETTINATKVFWGNPYMAEKMGVEDLSNYENLLGGFITAYFEKHNNLEPPFDGISSPYKKYSRRFNQNYNIKEGFPKKNWNLGSNVPGENVIWTAFIPKIAVERLKKDMNTLSEVPRGLEESLEDLPVFLNNFMYMNLPSIQKFEGAVAHEMTHLYIEKNTRIGDAKAENNLSRMLDESYNARRVLESVGGPKTKESQMREIIGNDYIEAIDEIFAYFVSLKYGIGPPDPEEGNETYGKPEIIRWGIKILKERSKEVNESKVDWARKTETKILETVAKKGQLRNSGGRRNPLIFFLINCLKKKEKESIQDFRKISEGELSKAFKDLNNLLNKIEQSKEDGEVLKFVSRFRKMTDWDNPDEILDQVLHKNFKEAIGNYNLKELRENIKKSLIKEIRALENKKKLLIKLENNINDRKTLEDIKGVKRELENLERDINKIKKEID